MQVLVLSPHNMPPVMVKPRLTTLASNPFHVNVTPIRMASNDRNWRDGTPSHVKVIRDHDDVFRLQDLVYSGIINPTPPKRDIKIIAQGGPITLGV